MLEEICQTIQNLNSNDENLRCQALDLYNKFQVPCYFSIDVFESLIKIENSPLFPLFAYKTLGLLIQNHWNDANDNLKAFISSNFPFVPSYDLQFNSGPIYLIALDTASKYVSVGMEEDSIISLFMSDRPESEAKGSIISSFFIDSFVYIISSSSKNQRNLRLRHFFSEQFHYLLSKYLFTPMTYYSPDSNEFLFFTSFIVRLIDIEPNMMESFLSDPNIENKFASIAPFIWDPNSPPQFISFFESILQLNPNQALFPNIFKSLINSFQVFTENYSLIFSNDLNGVNYFAYLESFFHRLPILPYLLEKCIFFSYSNIFPILSYLVSLFHSNSPSIIEIACNYISNFLQMPSIQTSFEFQSNFQEFLIHLFQSTLEIYSLQFSTLPGFEFDEDFNFQRIKKSISDLLEIITTYDIARPQIFSFLSSFLNYFITKENDFNSMDLKLLYSIRSFILCLNVFIKFPEGKEEEIHSMIPSIMEITNNYLSNISKFPLQLQKRVFNLFSKFTQIFYIHLELPSIMELFSKIISIVDDQSFISKDFTQMEPFVNFFNLFIKHFPFIQLQPEQIEKIHSFQPNHPFFWLFQTLFSSSQQFHQNLTDQNAILSSANQDLEWLISPHFSIKSPEDNSHINSLTFRIFSYLSTFEPNQSIMSDTINLILEKLIQSVNLFLNLLPECQFFEQILLIQNSITQIGLSILNLSRFSFEFLSSVISQLKPPPLILDSPFFDVAVIWIRKLCFPILIKLSSFFDSPNPQLVTYSTQIALYYSRIVKELEEQNELTQQIINILKKIAVQICFLCHVIDPSQIEQVTSSCLRINDFRIFNAVLDLIIDKGPDLLKTLWPYLLNRKDEQSIAKLAECLFKTCQNPNIFYELPGTKQESVSILLSKLETNASSKSIKKAFRVFIKSLL